MIADLYTTINMIGIWYPYGLQGFTFYMWSNNETD